MPSLHLLRHAKSSWDDPTLADADRPLSPRGLADAPRMGRFLKENDLIPLRVWASTSMRTRETALLVLREMSFPLHEIVWLPELYHATAAEILHLVKGCRGKGPLLVIAHEPGLSDLFGQYTGERLAKFPTAAWAGLELNHWNDPDARSWQFWTPKSITLR